MSRLVWGEDNRVGSFVMSRCGAEWFPGRGLTLGVEDDSGNLLAGVIYESYNGVNCFMHCAAREKVTFLPRTFFRAMFQFIFLERGCERITGLVESTNLKARRVDEALGWVEETRIIGAGINGGDIIVYKMTRETCKWLPKENE